MKFTQDWFSNNINNFLNIKTELKKINNILEIGCFEGRATCWMLEHMLDKNGTIITIDTFSGSDEHAGMDLKDLYQTFMANVKETKGPDQKVFPYVANSHRGLAEVIVANYKFDFIYIDGSHRAPDVLADACMAFPLLRPGGIMLFDDYMWLGMPGILNQPKIGVDAFTTMFSDQCAVRMVGYQLAVQKFEDAKVAA